MVSFYQIKKFCISFFFLIIACNLFSQYTKEVIIISTKVGNLIDSIERIQFGLFPEYSIDEFHAAQFLRTDKSKLEFIIYLKNGEKEIKSIEEHEFRTIQKQINKITIDYTEIDSSYIYALLLVDESNIKGRFIEITEKEVTVETSYLGSVTIPKSKILKIDKLISIENAQSRRWFDNPHESRHFFAPTARSLYKGEGYFQNVYLFLGFINYGITDNILIGGGFSFLPGIGLDRQALFLNPKLSFKIKEKFYLGGGIFYLNLPHSEWDEYSDKETLSRQHATIFYGVGTYGSQENNMTLGIGYLNYPRESLHKPLLMLGGMYRISRRTAFVTENWFTILNYNYDRDADPVDIKWEEQLYFVWYGDHGWIESREGFDDLEETVYKTNAPVGVTMYGVRFFSEKLCVDLGFFNLLGDFGDLGVYFPGIPYLDFVVKF